MMVLLKSASVTTLLLISLLLPAHAAAQLSENEVVQFVPSKSIMVANLNVETILDSLSEEADLLGEFRKRDSASLLDFTEKKQRLIVMFDPELNDPNPLDLPFVILDRFADKIEPAKILNAANQQNPGFETFEATTSDGVEMLIGKYGIEFEGMHLSENAFCFPKEDMVASGTLPVIKAFMADQSQDEDGPTCIDELDWEAEFHMILEGDKNMMQISGVPEIVDSMNAGGVWSIPGGGSLKEALESLDRLEVLFNSEQMMPLQVSLKFDSERSAEQIEELIEIGMQSAPAFFTMAQSEPAPKGIEDDIKSLLDLAKKAHQEIQVERDGVSIEMTLSSIEGLGEMPALILRLYMKQQMAIDKMKADFEHIEADLRIDDNQR